MSKFIITGIQEPGRINAMVKGRFTDVELFKAPEDILEELYNSKCTYVQLAPRELVRRNPDLRNINVKPIKVSKKK